MRLAFAAIVASLLWASACSSAGTDRPLQIESRASFSLRAGESAQVRDGILRVGFEGVSADSRCPKGEQCIRAGDATVRVWLQRGSGPREPLELHAAPGPAQALRVLDQELRLLRLDPYPVTGRPVSKQDYVVTLALEPRLSSEAER